MAALNIDAALIRRHVVSTTREKLIQLQNGCICCTLRGDLLEELARLAKNGQCDYVVIESTGISEPMQVAETFTAAFTEAMLQAGQEDENIGGTEILHEMYVITFVLVDIFYADIHSAELGGLQQIAQLDTLVTVIDAFNFQTNFATTEFISDRWGKDDLDPEDERTVTDLMVDQMYVMPPVSTSTNSTVNSPRPSSSTKSALSRHLHVYAFSPSSKNSIPPPRSSPRTTVASPSETSSTRVSMILRKPLRAWVGSRACTILPCEMSMGRRRSRPSPRRRSMVFPVSSTVLDVPFIQRDSFV